VELAGKQILVTGAGGFIGSHLTESLLHAGCHVRAFVHYNAMNRWGWLDHFPRPLRDQVEIFAGDIRDPHGVIEAAAGCQIVFHLAALIGIPYSYHSPDTYIDTNVRGTLNILQAARQLGIQKVVHTSTSEVYGTAQYVPIDENHPLQAQSPYAASKIGADQLALSFYRSFNTPVAVIRPFNTYGPRQSNRAVIPTIISQIAAGQRSIRLGALSPTRDFNFVEDTVNGFIAVAKTDDAVGEIINIGSNDEISIGTLARTIAEVMGVEVTLHTEEERLRPEKSEVNRLWADNSKARELLEWRPAYGGIEGLKKGLKITADWFCQPENLAFYKTDQYTI
jgi:dTDP-glucose 4,6-dehydratase